MLRFCISIYILDVMVKKLLSLNGDMPAVMESNAGVISSEKIKISKSFLGNYCLFLKNVLSDAPEYYCMNNWQTYSSIRNVRFLEPGYELCQGAFIIYG